MCVILLYGCKYSISELTFTLRMYKQDWKDMKKYLRGMKGYFNYLLASLILPLSCSFPIHREVKDEERAELFTGFAVVVREGESAGESSVLISRVNLG